MCPDLLGNVFEFDRLDPITDLASGPMRVARRSISQNFGGNLGTGHTDRSSDGWHSSRRKASHRPCHRFHFVGLAEHDQVKLSGSHTVPIYLLSIRHAHLSVMQYHAHHSQSIEKGEAERPRGAKDPKPSFPSGNLGGKLGAMRVWLSIEILTEGYQTMGIGFYARREKLKSNRYTQRSSMNSAHNMNLHFRCSFSITAWPEP